MGISPQRKVGDSAPSTATTPLPNCGGSPRTSEPGMRTKPAKVWTMETAPRSSPLAGRNGTGGVLRLPFNGSRFNSSVIPRAQQQERRRPSRALGPRPKAFLQASPEGPGLAACLPGSPHTHTHTGPSRVKGALGSWAMEAQVGAQGWWAPGAQGGAGHLHMLVLIRDWLLAGVSSPWFPSRGGDWGGDTDAQCGRCAQVLPLRPLPPTGLTLTWIWLRSTAARRIMALARRWNSLPMSRDFSKVVLRWSTSLAYRICRGSGSAGLQALPAPHSPTRAWTPCCGSRSGR